ncbi:MAG: methyltransferase domain-containing protein [Anaerolineaceae bacterium]|nr:methyltransferase domain-containing protein [Anaerolineaceae bacterium]
MKHLNLGCGHRFHPDWTNINFVSTGENVIVHDLTRGIPFPDTMFSVVYHSHLLEHFPKSLAPKLIEECYRVLRPHGILRIAVPDLEQIVRMYVEAIECARAGSPEWAENYEWIMLELYDQTVRNHSGGEIGIYLSNSSISNKEFVLKRLGIEAKKIIEAKSRSQSQRKLISSPSPTPKNSIKHLYRMLRYPNYRREYLIKRVLGKEYQTLQLGRFRTQGEIHQWMYDSYSLGNLLEKVGFERIKKQTAMESYIQNWTRFNLDTEPDGTIYKPDSLYMEAEKPG